MTQATPAPSHHIHVGECLESGWATFKQHASAHILIAFALLVATAVAQGVLAMASAPIGGAALALLSGLFNGAFMNVARVSSRGRAPTLNDAFMPFQERQGDYLVVGLAMTAGVLVFGIGVLVTYFLFLFSPLLVLEGRDFKQALVQSKDLVLTHAGDVALLYLALMALNLAGALLCGLGLFVTAPISALALVKAYDQLTGDAGVLVAEASPPSPPMERAPEP